MAWTHLLLAGLFEIGFALGLKHTDGFTRLWPSLGTAMAAAASLYLLTLALRSIPVGTASAVWTGIGAVGVATLGVLLLGEAAVGAGLVGAGRLLTHARHLPLAIGFVCLGVRKRRARAQQG